MFMLHFPPENMFKEKKRKKFLLRLTIKRSVEKKVMGMDKKKEKRIIKEGIKNDPGN